MMAFKRLTLNLSSSAIIPPGVSAVLRANRLGHHTRSGTTRYRLNLTVRVYGTDSVYKETNFPYFSEC